MNNFVNGWESKKEKLKRKFPKIINRDLRLYEGNEKAMITMLGHKLGKTEQELLSIIIGL
jgi:hypothetical protein